PDIYYLSLHDALPIYHFMRSDEAIGAASVGTSDAVEVGELFAVNTFAPLSVLFSLENMRSHYGYLLVEISGLLHFSSTKNSQVLDRKSTRLNSSHVSI